MAMYSSYYHTNSSNFFGSTPTSFANDSVDISVPSLEPKESFTSCGSCGSKLLSYAGGFKTQTEEERIFALQLKAAAVFNKMDVPPPTPPTTTTTASDSTDVFPPVFSVPPPSIANSVSSSVFPFTRYPPPSVVHNYSSPQLETEAATSSSSPLLVPIQGDVTTPPVSTTTNSTLCEISSPSGQ
ncbi:UNVERIFIED_CONTAM: hypothetical protein RMT77_001189 [Armadillidium vulgare]